MLYQLASNSVELFCWKTYVNYPVCRTRKYIFLLIARDMLAILPTYKLTQINSTTAPTNSRVSPVVDLLFSCAGTSSCFFCSCFFACNAVEYRFRATEEAYYVANTSLHAKTLYNIMDILCLNGDVKALLRAMATNLFTSYLDQVHLR